MDITIKSPRRKAKGHETRLTLSKLSSKLKMHTRNATVSNVNLFRQPSSKPGFRQDGHELALYAALANEEYDVVQ